MEVGNSLSSIPALPTTTSTKESSAPYRVLIDSGNPEGEQRRQPTTKLGVRLSTSAHAKRATELTTVRIAAVSQRMAAAACMHFAPQASTSSPGASATTSSTPPLLDDSARRYSQEPRSGQGLFQTTYARNHRKLEVPHVMHLASCQLVSSVQGCKEIADNSSGVTRCYNWGQWPF